MATEFKLPDLGENIASGDVVTVFVSEGDVVKPGQALLEVETDKAVIEVPCPPGGRIAQVLVKKGDTVKVGQTLVLLDAVGAASAPAKPAPQASTQASTQAPPQAQSSSPAPTPAPKPVAAPAPVQPAAAAPVATAAVASSQRAAVAEPADAATTAVDPAGPAVRRLARELGVDLGRIRGSGPAGRIVREPGLILRRGPSVFVRSFEWLPKPTTDNLRVLYEDAWLIAVDRRCRCPRS